MYLPFIIISLVYGLRLILRHMFPKSLKARQALVFLMGMFSLILLVGCFTGYARWLSLSERGQQASAEVIFTGTCTDNIFITGTHNRMYKKILQVPAESYEASAQPFTDDLGHGSLIYRIGNAAASASVGATVESVVASLSAPQHAQLRIAGNVQPQLENTTANSGALVPAGENAVAVAKAGELAAHVAQASQQAGGQGGFGCVGYRFLNTSSDTWVYAQEMAQASLGSALDIRYNPRYPEENWSMDMIYYFMHDCMKTALVLVGVLAETLFSGYWLGIRKQRKAL